MDDVPLETAVRLLAETANLKVVRTGNVLYVTPRASANELRKTGAVEGMQGAYDSPVVFRGRINGVLRNRNIIFDESVPAGVNALPLTEPLSPPPPEKAEPAPKEDGKKPSPPPP